MASILEPEVGNSGKYKRAMYVNHTSQLKHPGLGDHCVILSSKEQTSSRVRYVQDASQNILTSLIAIYLSMNMYANSTRSVPKVTIVPLEISGDQPQGGRALLKSGFLRQLLLQQGEVASTLQSHPDLGSHTSDSHSATGLQLLSRFEGTPVSLSLPSPAVISKIPTSDLLHFGKALVKTRQQRLKQLEDQHTASGNTSVGVESFRATFATKSDLGRQTHLVNLAMGALSGFTANSSVSPLGMLNLERLDMTPAGIEKGELLATIPLAPMEKTSVVQQEWSVINEEFTTIVTDSLENFSQTGVTENTELTSDNVSNRSGNEFNVTASASGSCGFVSGSASTTFGSQGSDSQSATDSVKHAVQTTRQASSRVKQSRKVTISTSSVTGSSESTTEPWKIQVRPMLCESTISA